MNDVYFHVLPTQANSLIIIKNFFFMFSVTNLKYWGRCEPVISRTLQFLNLLLRIMFVYLALFSANKAVLPIFYTEEVRGQVEAQNLRPSVQRYFLTRN